MARMRLTNLERQRAAVQGAVSDDLDKDIVWIQAVC
jgi:hypothetical protein